MQVLQAQSPSVSFDRDAVERRVREVLRLRATGRRQDRDRYYAPGFVFEAVGPEALKPWVGRFESYEELSRIRRHIMIEFELLGDALLDLTVDGETCMTLRRATYRNRGGGAPCAFLVWERYRFENGLIKSILQQADPVALARLTGRLQLLAALDAD